MKLAAYMPIVIIGILTVMIVLVFGKMNIYTLLTGLGVGMIVYSSTESAMIASVSIAITFLMIGFLNRYYKNEGFNTNTGSTDIAGLLQRLKKERLEGFKDTEESDEGEKEDDSSEKGDSSTCLDDVNKINVYNKKSIQSSDKSIKQMDMIIKNMPQAYESLKQARDFSKQAEKYTSKYNKKEGFSSNVYENIAKHGYNSPGFGIAGPLVEGYEDVKKEKDEMPAPASKKETLPMPFKLGEIPSQVKNGPHIDAGSTLISAIKSLNPDQINAMSKDTQQLIETQKSLMNMLGSMKPMLNDGKELMNTFQQMFGQ